MRRSVLLVVVVALTTQIFAPVAMAQDDNPSADDRGANIPGMDDQSLGNRGADDSRGGARTFDDNPSADDRGFKARGFDDNPTGADDMMASPTASASAASGVGEDNVTKTFVSEVLPSTGGPSLVALVSAATLVLLVGSGLVARRLVRGGR
jgi:hypothetical protein